jgi:hypothetical protein
MKKSGQANTHDPRLVTLSAQVDQVKQSRGKTTLDEDCSRLLVTLGKMECKIEAGTNSISRCF